MLNLLCIGAGATWKLCGGREINVAYVHAFGETVNGVSSIPPGAGGGNANASMHQDSVGLGFGRSEEQRGKCRRWVPLKMT